MSAPFRDAADAYIEAGWTSPLPLGPAGKAACKAPPPSKPATTGHAAIAPTDRVIESWKDSHGLNNIGLHLADELGMIALDVDDYVSASGKVKSGGATLAELEAELGELPPTFMCTSRGFGSSGIRVYRVAPGSEYVSKLPSIDVIQPKHRYMVVWPSVHPDTGETYFWYDPNGRKLRKPPNVADVVWLPKAWVAYLLSAKATGLDKSAQANDDEVRSWLSEHAGPLCRASKNVLAQEIAALTDADAGARYDSMVSGVMALVRLGTEGHHGTKAALARLRQAYFEAIGGDREDDALSGEWRRSIVGAVAAVMDADELPEHGARCPDRERERDEGESEPWPSPAQPRRAAERLVAELWSQDGAVTLCNWRDDFWRWSGTCWSLVKLADLRARAWSVLDGALYDGASGALEWTPNKTRIANVLEGLASVVHRASEAEVCTGDEDVALIPFANGVLRLTRSNGQRELSEHSPELFNTYCLPFAFDEDAPPPIEWLSFLKSLEIDDDTVDLLQEWFGYVVSGDLSKNRMLYLYGETRAGKGVITRTLQRLVGLENIASPNLAQFGEPFGMQPTVGKTLITVNDARFRGAKTAELVERLLNFTGDDEMTINRKNREPWVGRPSARVMIVSNDLPSITGEQTTAFAKRIIGPIRLHKSFYDHEDEGLERRLRRELPAILMWAFDGYDRLCEQGRFTVPAESARLHREIEESMSPVLSFVSERCTTGADERVPKDQLYAAYRNWCSESGIYVPSKVEFGRQLQGSDAKVYPTKVPTRNGDRVHGWRGVSLNERESLL
jgi:putative DNA primase/helicase